MCHMSPSAGGFLNGVRRGFGFRGFRGFRADAREGVLVRRAVPWVWVWVRAIPRGPAGDKVKLNVIKPVVPVADRMLVLEKREGCGGHWSSSGVPYGAT